MECLCCSDEAVTNAGCAAIASQRENFYLDSQLGAVHDVVPHL